MTIQMAPMTAKMKDVAKKDDNTLLVRGQRVKLVGLKARADMNGKYGTLMGTLLEWVSDVGRWGLRVEDETHECVRIKPANLLG